jgi:hypothetical protein
MKIIRPTANAKEKYIDEKNKADDLMTGRNLYA